MPPRRSPTQNSRVITINGSIWVRIHPHKIAALTQKLAAKVFPFITLRKWTQDFQIGINNAPDSFIAPNDAGDG